MGNPLYQSLKNGKIKVDLHPLNYPLFSPLVALYCCFLFVFFFIKKLFSFKSCEVDSVDVLCSLFSPP